MTPDEIATLRTDLLSFTQYAFEKRRGAPFKVAPHHAVICDALERVVIGRTKRLIINIPPRSGKTELAVKNFIPWCMGNFPDSEFIHASYSKRLATTNTYEARAIMQHESFAEVFGAPSFMGDSNAKDEFRTKQGGIVYAAGADGTITGYGAGKMRDTFGGAIVIDDPHKAGEGNSKIMRQNVIDWFSTTMESRKNTPDTPIIIIMQRLHEMDLAGWLLGGGNGEEWAHVNIPARDDDGDSFWPEQFPQDMLDRIEAKNSYVFAGQYMQRPAPVGGGLFKDEWWRVVSVSPRIKSRTIYADTAQKTKEANDYSVFQCWGETYDGQVIMLDMVRGKWEAPELAMQARAFWAKHKNIAGKGAVRAFKVEDKVSGTGLIQTLKREGIPMVGISRSIDKVTRAYDAAPLVESGNVLIMQDCPHLSDFLTEATAFPNGANDDTIDPMMDAVTDMLKPTSDPGIRSL